MRSNVRRRAVALPIATFTFPRTGNRGDLKFIHVSSRSSYVPGQCSRLGSLVTLISKKIAVSRGTMRSSDGAGEGRREGGTGEEGTFGNLMSEIRCDLYIYIYTATPQCIRRRKGTMHRDIRAKSSWFRGDSKSIPTYVDNVSARRAQSRLASPIDSVAEAKRKGVGTPRYKGRGEGYPGRRSSVLLGTVGDDISQRGRMHDNCVYVARYDAEFAVYSVYSAASTSCVTSFRPRRLSNLMEINLSNTTENI